MDEVYQAVNQARVDHVDLIVPDVIEYLIYRFSDEGFDLSEPKCANVLALVESSIRGALYRSVDLYHPLAELAEDLLKEEAPPPNDSD
jgi:hypothetical protein